MVICFTHAVRPSVRPLSKTRTLYNAKAKTKPLFKAEVGAWWITEFLDLFSILFQKIWSFGIIAKPFFDTLAKFGSPTLVSSAGWADIIEHMLKSNGFLTSNVRVFANFLKYDNDGFVTGYKGEFVHPLNKHRANEREDMAPYFKEASQR